MHSWRTEFRLRLKEVIYSSFHRLIENMEEIYLLYHLHYSLIHNLKKYILGIIYWHIKYTSKIPCLVQAVRVSELFLNKCLNIIF